MNEKQVPIRNLIRAVESGDTAAEQMLWNELYDKLLRYLEARVRRRGVATGLIDNEAVAVSVLESVFKCAKHGRLERLQNWSDLSKLLFAMTNRKFVDHWRRATAQKAFPGTPLRELPADGTEGVGDEAPEVAMAFDEELTRLMNLLPDELHQQIAVLKLAGYTDSEVSDRLNRAAVTVNRKWRYIRETWADELRRSN